MALVVLLATVFIVWMDRDEYHDHADGTVDLLAAEHGAGWTTNDGHSSRYDVPEGDDASVVTGPRAIAPSADGE
ncbi:hypothetical protein [Streptomyces platensis]